MSGFTSSTFVDSAGGASAQIGVERHTTTKEAKNALIGITSFESMTRNRIGGDSDDVAKRDHVPSARRLGDDKRFLRKRQHRRLTIGDAERGVVRQFDI